MLFQVTKLFLFVILVQIVLQCLHVFWFYLIVKMAWRLLAGYNIEKDVRSDDDDVLIIEGEAETDGKKEGKQE